MKTQTLTIKSKEQKTRLLEIMSLSYFVNIPAKRIRVYVHGDLTIECCTPLGPHFAWALALCYNDDLYQELMSHISKRLNNPQTICVKAMIRLIGIKFFHSVETELNLNQIMFLLHQLYIANEKLNQPRIYFHGTNHNQYDNDVFKENVQEIVKHVCAVLEDTSLEMTNLKYVVFDSFRDKQAYKMPLHDLYFTK